MRRLVQLLSLTLALALIAAACSGDDSDEVGGDGDGAAPRGVAGADGQAGGGGDADAEAAADAVEVAAGAQAGGGGDASSIDQLEAEWAENRQAVVDAIVDGGFGVDDENVLVGPAGFEIDLSDCPSDWEDTAGLGDAITIGHTTAQSGNLASYGRIATGMEVYFDYVNDEFGGVGGLPIELVVRDDEYVATRTIELVDEIVDAEEPFMVNTLGAPNTLAVYDKLNDLCIPHPFVMSGHPAWGDPVGHPWTTGQQLSFSTEALLWGHWIKTNLVDDLPVTVSGLVMDNGFGLAYQDSFQRWADANPDVVSEFQAVLHDPGASIVTGEMATIAAEGPDVFIAMTAADACVSAMQEAGSSGLTETAEALFAPSVCKDPNVYMIPAGEAADGWYIVGGGAKATTDPQYAEEPYIEFLNDELAAADLDTTIGFYGAGFGSFAWPIVETLRIAADLPGGLSRTNFILAARSLDLDNPMLLDGVSFSVDGAEDGFYVEGSEYYRYDAANASWIQQGVVVDLNGLSPNCSWTAEGC